jgi:hypothetical protein
MNDFLTDLSWFSNRVRSYLDGFESGATRTGGIVNLRYRRVLLHSCRRFVLKLLQNR